MSFLGFTSHGGYSQSKVMLWRSGVDLIIQFAGQVKYPLIRLSVVPATQLLAMSRKDSTGKIGGRQSSIGDSFDPVELPARIRSHPAQVAEEDWQLAQASLKARLKVKAWKLGRKETLSQLIKGIELRVTFYSRFGTIRRFCDAFFLQTLILAVTSRTWAASASGVKEHTAWNQNRTANVLHPDGAGHDW